MTRRLVAIFTNPTGISTLYWYNPRTRTYTLRVEVTTANDTSSVFGAPPVSVEVSEYANTSEEVNDPSEHRAETEDTQRSAGSSRQVDACRLHLTKACAYSGSVSVFVRDVMKCLEKPRRTRGGALLE